MTAPSNRAWLCVFKVGLRAWVRWDMALLAAGNTALWLCTPPLAQSLSTAGAGFVTGEVFSICLL